MSFDLLKIFYNHGINIIGLEVFPNRMLIKFSKIDQRDLQVLVDSLNNVDEVDSVQSIHLLNHEVNERKLTSAIESIPKGIISINKKHVIEIVNDLALEFLGLERDQVVGVNCEEFLKKDQQVFEIICQGNDFENLKLSINGKTYLSSLKIIKDDHANQQGMILTFEEYAKAVKTASVVLNDYDSNFEHIVGISEPMNRVKDTIKAVAPTPSSILLRGESGTGKEVFAKAIHALSKRKERPFIAINCASLPDTLIESELFGYEKGSFTGADRSHEGYFKQADGGTIFLDEIGELSASIQAKLLRVLQENTVRKIGSRKEEKVDFRLIAATNRNLEEMINQGLFREDLYYRINVMPIFIPPLRDRAEDMPHLLEYFIQLFNNKLGKNVTTVSDDFYNDLLTRSWPGNIRELQNHIERSMLLLKSNVLELSNSSPIVNKTVYQPMEFEGSEASLKDMVSVYEKRIIESKLKDEKSVRQTAKKLKISHTALNKKMKKYGL